MHLLMADVTVLEARRAQVVNPGRCGADGAIGRRLGPRQIGMAFQAHKPNVRAGQHPRIGRAVGLVARAAAFQAHGSVLEGEGSALVAVALEAAGLVGVSGLDGARPQGSVRIVAIHARHGAFRKAMFVGPLETGPLGGVATGAELVDVRELAGHQAIGSVLVDGVAGHATHLVFGMSAVDSSHVGGLIEMAGEAELVGLRGLELGGLPDIGGIHGFRVLASGAMAGLAGVVFKAAFLVLFHYLVGVFLEGVEDVFVAPLAGGRADEFRRLVVRWGWGGGARLGRFLRRSAPRVDREQHGCHASHTGRTRATTRFVQQPKHDGLSP